MNIKITNILTSTTMKKITFTFLTLFLLLEVFGQRAFIFDQVNQVPDRMNQPPWEISGSKIAESFETWPPAGWTFLSPDGGKGWARTSIADTPLYNAGDYAAFAFYGSGGATYNDQWMISPAVTISSGDMLSFWMSVLESTHYKDKVEVRISTSGKNTTDFTTVVEAINIPAASDVPWTRHTYDLSTYAGKTIYIALRETVADNLHEGAVVFVDLFQVGTLSQTDLALTTTTIPSCLGPGNTDIAGNILNLGTKTITSATINYQVDQGTTQSSALSGLSLLPGSEMIITSSVKYSAVSGNHTIKIWISDVNGLATDDVFENNSLSKSLLVGSQTTTNIPIFEEFTSSTCGPCASFNTILLNPFIDLHLNEISLVKYQMSWPTPGDPYYTAEGGTRRSFYGINAVPTLMIGGIKATKNSTYINQALSKEKSKPAFFTLKMEHEISIPAKEFKVKVLVTPYVTSNDFTMHIAVVEKETVNNVKTNGEKSFHFVMMKMIPDANGTNLSCVENIPMTFNYTANLNGTHIEEFTDLAAVAFIQNNLNKEIYQSSAGLLVGSNERTLSDQLETAVYPNPFNNEVTIQLNSPESTGLSIEVLALDGRKVKQLINEVYITKGMHSFSWNGKNNREQQVTPGVYLLRIRTDKSELNRKIILSQ
jgi:hypothetical protein